MSCCGSRNVTIRQQAIQPAERPRTVTVQRITRSTTGPAKLEVHRQSVTAPTKCPKCGFPTMAVNISGRGRTQCSNANCRHIVQ